MQLSKKDESYLKKVHPDLVRVVRRAAASLGAADNGFVITCGIRTVEEQKKNVARGASKTMRSRHLPNRAGVSCAVDVAVTIDGKVRWDWPLYARMAKVFKAAAAAEKVPIEWGGDWKSLRDGPHFQLPWASYP